MSKVQTFRALVNERLCAAAEEITVLFERTIAEFEEEVRCSLELSEWKRQVLNPRVELVSGNVPSVSHGADLNQVRTETPHIKEEKEEQSLKLEEEQLPVPVLEFSDACVKSEESSLLHQTEHREETQADNISLEPYLLSRTGEHTEHSSDADYGDWEPNFSTPQLETEADGDHYNQVQIKIKNTKQSPPNMSPPEMSATVESGGPYSEAEWKVHQCSLCQKRFWTLAQLERHLRAHAGDKPYSCSVCKKTFKRTSTRNVHMRIHTGEKPHSCSICKKAFTRKSGLTAHMKSHTGIKLYSCSICNKTFLHKSSQSAHMTVHTGEKPYSCSICKKSFTRQTALLNHRLTHTGTKFKCSVCKKEFTKRCNLDRHKRTHAEEKPYSCSICDQACTQAELFLHMRMHS